MTQPENRVQLDADPDYYQEIDPDAYHGILDKYGLLTVCGIPYRAADDMQYVLSSGPIDCPTCLEIVERIKTIY